MATPESIAIRRDDALARAKAAADVITKVTGAAFAPFPAPTKHLDQRPATEAEWLADTLEAIAKRSAELGDAQVLESQIEDLTATVAAITKERDDALADVQLHNEHVNQEQATLDAVQRLVKLAVDNGYVRSALTESGWLQAKQDGEGGWSVSVTGVGPDLFAEPVTEPPQGDASAAVDPAELATMKRADLNDHAAKLGVPDPHTLPNKDAVIAAIKDVAATQGDGVPDTSVAVENQPQ